MLGGSLTQISMPVIATAAFILGRLGLLQSAETVGPSLFALGASTMLGLALLGLDVWRCWNETANPAVPARARTD